MTQETNKNDLNSIKSNLPLFSSKDKYIFRLKNYFQPYASEFKINFLENQPLKDKKIRAVQISKDKKKNKPGIFSIKLDSRLYEGLQVIKKEKINLESSLLKLALNYKSSSRKAEFNDENFLDESKEASFFDDILNKYIEKQKLEEKTEIETTLKELTPKKLKELWIKIRQEYFPEREDIDSYKVVWSERRQTSCLASCHIQKKKISVAKAMKEAESLEFLEPLLYHEMCHAILGEPKIVAGRRIMHGKDFKELERKHPGTKTLNVWIKAGGWDKAVKESES